MRRSTFVSLGLAAFGSILATFLVRGTTRMVIGDRTSILLATPVALLSLALVSVLLAAALGDVTGLYRMENDLDDSE